MARKKKRKTASRRKRFKRAQRLESAKAWLAAYDGHNLARAYRRRYGIDWQTAFTELEMLDVAIDPDYKNKVLQSVAGELATRRREQADREAETQAELGFEQDDYFGYIVGYTSGGAAYGLTWDEWEAIEREEGINGQIDAERADEEGAGP